MLVFTIHGFGTTGDGDSFCQRVVEITENNDSIGFAPTYPTNNPHLANIYLAYFVESKLKYYNQDAVFVGANLGGFWARSLANTFGAKKLILFNPTIHPWASLQKYVGQNRNFVNGETFELSVNDANAHYIYRNDDGATAMQRIKTEFIAYDDSSVSVIDLFADKRNVNVHLVQKEAQAYDIIEKTLFSEENEDPDQE